MTLDLLSAGPSITGPVLLHGKCIAGVGAVTSALLDTGTSAHRTAASIFGGVLLPVENSICPGLARIWLFVGRVQMLFL